MPTPEGSGLISRLSLTFNVSFNSLAKFLGKENPRLRPGVEMAEDWCLLGKQTPTNQSSQTEQTASHQRQRAGLRNNIGSRCRGCETSGPGAAQVTGHMDISNRDAGSCIRVSEDENK